MPLTASSRRSASTLFAIVFLAIWGLITHGTFAGAGDEPHYLMIARSIAFDGDLELGNDYADAENLIGAGDVTPGPHAIAGRDGTLRPVHDIGLPVLAAPFVALAYRLAESSPSWISGPLMRRARLNPSLIFRHLLSLLMALVAAVVAIELWQAMQRAGLSTRSAFGWALLATLSPPLLSHSFLFLTEIPAALLMLIALRRILEPAPPARDWAINGLLVGLLTFIHVRNAPISLALALVAVVGHRERWQTLAPFAATIALVAVVRSLVQYAFWGTLLFNTHARLGELSTIADVGAETTRRLSGLLFDQEFGLLVLAPMYALALPGLIRLWREQPGVGRAAALIVAFAFASIALPMVNPYGWIGGFSPAPRFIVPIVPLLAISAAVLAYGLAGWHRRIAVALVALQIAIDVAVWNAPKSLWDDGDGLNALVGAWPLLRPVFELLPAWHGPLASPWPFAVASATLLVFTYCFTYPARARASAAVPGERERARPYRDEVAALAAEQSEAAEGRRGEASRPRKC